MPTFSEMDGRAGDIPSEWAVGYGNIADDEVKYGIVDKNTDALAEKVIAKAVLENETIIEAL